MKQNIAIETSGSVSSRSRSLSNRWLFSATVLLVTKIPTRYGFDLSFNTGEERTDDHYLTYVADLDLRLRPDIHKAAKAIRTVHEHHFGTPIRDDESPTLAGRQVCANLPEIENLEVWIRNVLPLLWVETPAPLTKKSLNCYAIVIR